VQSRGARRVGVDHGNTHVRPGERRGEAISTVVFYFMPGERDRRYRFFLNGKGEVADFSSEPVD
jgi:hypothetical protein